MQRAKAAHQPLSKRHAPAPPTAGGSGGGADAGARAPAFDAPAPTAIGPNWLGADWASPSAAEGAGGRAPAGRPAAPPPAPPWRSPAEAGLQPAAPAAPGPLPPPIRAPPAVASTRAAAPESAKAIPTVPGGAVPQDPGAPAPGYRRRASTGTAAASMSTMPAPDLFGGFLTVPVPPAAPTLLLPPQTDAGRPTSLQRSSDSGGGGCDSPPNLNIRFAQSISISRRNSDADAPDKQSRRASEALLVPPQAEEAPPEGRRTMRRRSLSVCTKPPAPADSAPQAPATPPANGGEQMRKTSMSPSMLSSGTVCSFPTPQAINPLTPHGTLSGSPLSYTHAQQGFPDIVIGAGCKPKAGGGAAFPACGADLDTPAVAETPGTEVQAVPPPTGALPRAVQSPDSEAHGVQSPRSATCPVGAQPPAQDRPPIGSVLQSSADVCATIATAAEQELLGGGAHQVARRGSAQGTSQLSVQQEKAPQSFASPTDLGTVRRLPTTLPGSLHTPPPPDGSAAAIATTHGRTSSVVSKARRSRAQSTLSQIGVAKNSCLRQSDINMKVLSQAFQRLSRGNGELDLAEFRALWKHVFPGRPMDAETWRNIERMFKEMDEDGSDAITFDEVIAYLEKHRREELTLSKRPENAREWVWQFCTTDVATDWKADSIRDMCIVRCIYLWKTTSQIMVLISIVVLMIESLPGMQSEDGSSGNATTRTLETICVVFFTLEIIGWMYSYPLRPQEDEEEDDDDEEEEDADEDDKAKRETAKTDEQQPPCSKRWRQIFSELNTWIDLLSILPWYLDHLPLASGTEQAAPLAAVRLARLLRLLRIFRILKVGKGRFGRAPELGSAFRKSLISLNFLLTLIVIAMCLSASFVFYAETEDATFNMTLQRWVRNADSKYIDAGNPTMFQSIPHSLWWGIVTLTTVGYGDMYPITAGGKVIASLTMLAGLIVVGFPITILTSTFQAMEEQREAKEHRTQLCREFYRGIKAWVEKLSEAAQQGDISQLALKIGSPGSPTKGVDTDERGGPAVDTALSALQVSIRNIAVSFPAAVQEAQRSISARIDDLNQRIDLVEKRQQQLAARIGHEAAAPESGASEPAGDAAFA
eukprot:TRINITY_DN8705_c0_g1_i1.p1 TRINITY_DN8705_c0_g1~~TRINITY_DN8705_c0_g1_i1.p1  ORF type:complete len:1098 (+),score=255.93 TRINITY_DN8705_c0_g1_i1:108-3401(+)